jgi:hypothetical protein
LDEIADREANQTFFGFLNSEPIDRPISKRVKNRPVSVGSLGSIVVQTTKKPQLKSRAISAIITSTSNTTNMPKKIKPSQSMPLSKKQLQKKSSSSRKNSTDLNQQDVYSSTAYINSNITLSKALKPQRGQMSSMIPIASRASLTTTKSL